MGVFTNPALMLVESTQAENVDTVVVDGRILKCGGKLTALAIDQVIRDAAARKLSQLAPSRCSSAFGHLG